jgi:uncharacterized protein (DUF1684 family)
VSGRSPREALELAHYRARVAQLYVESAGGGANATAEFRRRRDRLFAEHAASALTPEQRERIDSGGEDGLVPYSRVGRLETPWDELTLFWTEGYGGNLFLPFRDATAPAETYGAGRYLTDAIKGTFHGGLEATLPGDGSAAVTLDFNYAYNPSCAYTSRWACPLAPPENGLDRPIRAGELRSPAAV